MPTTTTRLRVRYAETDQMGVAYYANYLVWFEVARTDFLRHFGWTYRDMEAGGVFGFDLEDGRWREWHGRDAEEFAAVLDYNLAGDGVLSGTEVARELGVTVADG